MSNNNNYEAIIKRLDEIEAYIKRNNTKTRDLIVLHSDLSVLRGIFKDALYHSDSIDSTWGHINLERIKILIAAIGFSIDDFSLLKDNVYYKTLTEYYFAIKLDFKALEKLHADTKDFKPINLTTLINKPNHNKQEVEILDNIRELISCLNRWACECQDSTLELILSL